MGEVNETKAGRRITRGGALWLCASLLLHLLLIGLLPPPVEALEAASSVLQVRLAPMAQAVLLPEPQVPVEQEPLSPPEMQQSDQPVAAQRPTAFPQRPLQQPSQQQPDPPQGGKAEELAKEAAPATSTAPQTLASGDLISTINSSSSVPPSNEGLPGGEDKPSRGPVADPGNAAPVPAVKPVEDVKPAADDKALFKAYGAGVNSKIRGRQSMPAEAERLMLSGSVTLAISIDESGELLDVSIAGSSGHSVIDEAALEAVRESAPFDPFPAEAQRKQVKFNFTLKYTNKEKTG